MRRLLNKFKEKIVTFISVVALIDLISIMFRTEYNGEELVFISGVLVALFLKKGRK